MSATNRGCERKAYDFYATPPETIRAFLANFDGISSGDRILEPSAGNGQIVKVLREGGYDNRIDAVELRPEERGALEALADNVTIGSFFDYEPDCGYYRADPGSGGCHRSSRALSRPERSEAL